MRIALLTAALVLVAGCASAPRVQPTLTPIPPKTPTASATTPATTTPTTPTTSAVPSAAPSGTSPIDAVIRWVGSGTAADPAGFHSATRDGVATRLDDGIAFVTPSGTTKCMTDPKAGGALACMVDLDNPPTRPADAYGEWIGGWVDFDGTTLAVGSAHGDPGPFAAGAGAQLPHGSSLRFGDYQCRSDPAGLFCVNYAHLSGAKFADSGVEPLGCLRSVPQPDLGLKFSC
jgi:hypothetical protein